MMLEDLLPKDGSWLPLVVLVSLIFGRYAIFSKAASEKLWLVGRIGRWWKDRKAREIEENSRLADVTMAGHEAERERRQREYEADRKHWKREMERLRAEAAASQRESQKKQEQSDRRVAAVERKLDRYWDYIVYVAAFGRRLALMAAQHGWDPPPPMLQSFDEWENDQHRSP